MTPTVQLFNADCLEAMKELGNGSIDMILADLPYGTTACKWDTVIPFEPLWAQYKRIIKRNGAIVLTASQPFTSALVMSNPKWFRYEWIWQKQKGPNFPQAKRRPLKNHENVVVFYQTQCTYNPQMTDSHRVETRKGGTRFSSRGFSAMLRPGSSVCDKQLDSTYRGRYPKSVQHFQNEQMNRGSHHPTAKPLALMEYMIRTYTNEGETVLDNTMGSGTTGVACLNTGRHFIGMEKDAEIFATAQNRIEEAQQANESKLFALT